MVDIAVSMDVMRTVSSWDITASDWALAFEDCTKREKNRRVNVRERRFRPKCGTQVRGLKEQCRFEGVCPGLSTVSKRVAGASGGGLCIPQLFVVGANKQAGRQLTTKFGAQPPHLVVQVASHSFPHGMYTVHATAIPQSKGVWYERRAIMPEPYRAWEG